MEYVRLANTGAKVSRICLGSNNFGGQLDEPQSLKVIAKALDQGINIIDTANGYTRGKSEEIIGKAIKGARNDVLVATKVGMTLGDGPNQGGLSRKHIIHQVSESLRRLQTDYLDIYYLHQPDPTTPCEETFRTLRDLLRQGKVCYIGCSNFTQEQILEAVEVCDRLDMEKVAAIESRYNLLQRSEEEVLRFSKEKDMSVFSYSPLMGGFLTGKYHAESSPPPGSRASFRGDYWARINGRQNYVALDVVRRAAANSGLSLANLAIAWLLNNQAITAPIVGASSPEQIAEDCSALNAQIPRQVMDMLRNEVSYL